jgi:hypothetical protein
MSMKSRLSLVALIGAIAASATTTTANARQFNVSLCDMVSWGACGVYEPSLLVSRSRGHDTSPTYMKQTDPRYNSAMVNAGGGGGGGGGVGGGGR